MRSLVEGVCEYNNEQKFSDTLTACPYFKRIINGLREFFAGVR